MSDLSGLRTQLEEWKKRARTAIRATPSEREQSFQSGVLSTCDSVIELIDEHDADSQHGESDHVPGDD